MSSNANDGFGRTPGIDQNFSARNAGEKSVDNMLDGRDDPNRGPLDRAANALGGHDDPNRGPLDRAANALGGHDDPNRGPLDRTANALDGRDDPNRGPLDRTANTLGMGAGGMGSGAMGAGGMGAGAMATGTMAGGTSTTGTSGSAGSGRIVSAVFDSQAEAQQAVTALRNSGVADSALSIIAQHDGKTTTTSGDGTVDDDGHRNLLRGILGGGALGAGLAVAALAIPGVGPLAAAGAIAASAVPEAVAIGAVAGAAVGTLNETLTKHGVSEEDASYYSDRIKSGGVFVSVDTSSAGISADQIGEILHRNGGHSSARARMA